MILIWAKRSKNRLGLISVTSIDHDSALLGTIRRVNYSNRCCCQCWERVGAPILAVIYSISKDVKRVEHGRDKKSYKFTHIGSTLGRNLCSLGS